VTERGRGLREVVSAYQPRSAEEALDLERIRQLVATGGDPWIRSSPLHITGSAVVVDPRTRRVLLRWHERMQGWLQVGGHADPGETDPLSIALREAREETGLQDLLAWPEGAAPQPVHVAVVPVPAGEGEPPHQHADIRYALATAQPEAAVPEHQRAALVWLRIDEAQARVGEDNLRICLQRIGDLFDHS
jgi:8-oxo-dGTP pyrophosphatase MutT (NUDIX family)